MTDGVEITDEMLLAYSDEVYEKDDSRPVLIEPGFYDAEFVDWRKVYMPQFKKYNVVMDFRIGEYLIKGWFRIKPSDSHTTIKAGWKSKFLRMYQEVHNVRRPLAVSSKQEYDCSIVVLIYVQLLEGL